jgi:hypothetical protein
LEYFHCLVTIEYIRLNIEYLRSACGGSILKRTERHATQAPALRERHPQIFNLQSSIFNSPMNRDLRFAPTGSSGLGLFCGLKGGKLAIRK